MDREFIIVVGNQGAGKSVWTKLKTRALSRLFVTDPLRSYPCDSYYIDPDEIDRMMENPPERFRIGSDDPYDVPLLGNCGFVLGNCTLVVEECGIIFRRGVPLEPWARRAIFTGRHVGLNLIFLAQRIASIPIDIRSQANRVVSFRQIDPDDIAALSVFGKEFRDSVSGLPDLECIDWNRGEISSYSIASEAARIFGWNRSKNIDTESEGEEDQTDGAPKPVSPQP